jgi:polyisoprenoid-binding protein YceI
MSTQLEIPGYVAGTWAIDSVHSDVSFEIRHFGLFKTRGIFDDFAGTIVTAQNPLDSTVTAVVKTASVNTGNKRRDKDIHKDDFLSVAQYPTMTFASTGVRLDGDRFLVDGDLTIRATTKRVTLNLEPAGFGVDGRPVAKLTASTEISCNDFGVTRGMAAPVVGDKVRIVLEVQAGKQD